MEEIMAIIRYQPWSVLNHLQDEVNKIFEHNLRSTDTDASKVATSQWMPNVDIKEEPSRFIILADVPGVEPKNIEVKWENGVLTIKGEKRYENEEKGADYFRRERDVGTFYRRFSLPDTADSEKISAVGKHGVLEITIPKIQKSQPRNIEIKVQG